MDVVEEEIKLYILMTQTPENNPYNQFSLDQLNNENYDNKKALQLLDKRGLRLLSDTEINSMSSQFSEDLLHGLTSEQNGDLPMINTKICTNEFSQIAPGEESLVLVLGGTYIRVALVSIDDNKKPHIKIDATTGNPYYQEAIIKQHEFATPAAFYNAMINPVMPFLESSKPNAVGIIYAFGGKALEGEHGVDIQPFEKMGKKFLVPGISEQPVGEAMFQRPGLLHLAEVIRRASMNDMAPVCIAGDSKIGSIIATGFNIGVAHNGYYYVTEAGGHFKGLPIHEYAESIDEESNNPKHAVLEKQLAGGYLGLTLSKAIEDLQKHGFISLSSNNFTSEDLTSIVNEKNHFLKTMENKRQNILWATATRIGYRAAQAMGVLIGTTIQTLPQEFPDDTIVIPVVGPVFWAMHGFKEIAGKYAELYAQKNIHFADIPNADILGAGVAALRA